MKKISIRYKLIMLVFIILIPITVLQVIKIKENFDCYIRGELRASKNFVRAVNTAFINYLDKVLVGEYAIGMYLTSNSSLTVNEIQFYLENMRLQQKTVKAFSWVNPEGVIIASTNKHMAGKDLKNRVYIQRILSGEDKVVSGLVFSEEHHQDEAIIPVARGIRNEHGKLLGIVVAAVDASKLESKLPSYRVGKTGSFGIVDNQGIMVYRSDNNVIPYTERRVPKDSPVWRALKSKEVNTFKVSSIFDIDGSTRMRVDYPISEIEWECFVTLSVQEVLSQQLQETYRDIVVLLLVIIGSLSAAVILGNRILKPVNKLQKTAQSISQGDYSARTNIVGNDELAETAKIFDFMAQHMEESLQSSEKRMRMIFNNASLGIIVYREGVLIKTNPAFRELIGYTEEELSQISWSKFTYPDDVEQSMRFYREIVTGKLDNYQLEKRYIRKDGKLIWVRITAFASRGHSASDDYIVTFFEDITEKKTVQEQMVRLDRLNVVGEMAAGISHEIRNPMTTVRGFLQILQGKDDCSKYQDYFDLMIEELDRANSIITEFLSIGKYTPSELKKLNLNSIVNTIAPLIEADAVGQGKSLQLETNEIPDLILNSKEIRQVILNLCRNGLEAMSSGGLLSIRTYTEDGRVILAVQDEGEGIKPEVLEKLSTPFFTTKANGTGLGLSICYDIASRHNATIDIDTGSNGTTFYVKFNCY